MLTLRARHSDTGSWPMRPVGCPSHDSRLGASRATLADSVSYCDGFRMTDEDASEARSEGGLITQRMVAERGRLEASGCLILAAVMFAQAALRGVPTDALEWVFLAVSVVLGVGFIVLSVRVLRTRSKR